MKITGIIRVIRNKYFRFTNPIGYAERIGVNFPDGGLHIYGKIDWGTEPWIISIGNNVHITDGAKFKIPNT